MVGQVLNKQTSYATALALSILSVMLTAIVSMYVSTVIKEPQERLKELHQQIENEMKSHEQLLRKDLKRVEFLTEGHQQLLIDHGENFDVVIPLQHANLREEIATVRGSIESITARLVEMAQKDVRPDKFTGAMADRLEKRVRERITKIEDKLDKAVFKMTKLEHECLRKSIQQSSAEIEMGYPPRQDSSLRYSGPRQESGVVSTEYRQMRWNRIDDLDALR